MTTSLRLLIILVLSPCDSLQMLHHLDIAPSKSLYASSHSSPRSLSYILFCGLLKLAARSSFFAITRSDALQKGRSEEVHVVAEIPSRTVPHWVRREWSKSIIDKQAFPRSMSLCQKWGLMETGTLQKVETGHALFRARSTLLPICGQSCWYGPAADFH